MKKLILALACLFFIIPCWARVITVDDDGPADFNNIQAAIDDASNGDTVLVADGLYTGDGNRDIVFYKAVTVRSENGPANCIIDCNGQGTALSISGDEPDTIFSGFTITGGCADWSEELIEFGGNSVISNCIIRDNNCLAIVASYGGGSVINCTFHRNTVPEDAGAIAAYYTPHADRYINMTNCIMWGNSGPEFWGPACCKCGCGPIYYRYGVLESDWKYNSWYKEPPSYFYSNVLYSDPCFADPCNSDYHLKSEVGRWDPNSQTWVQDDVTSPAIDAGDPNFDWSQEPCPNGGRINMGAYGGTNQASKSLGCFPIDYPDYDEWINVGCPPCWCYSRQCHGDADDAMEYIAKKGYYYVHYKDLDLLLDAWRIQEPPFGPGIKWPDPKICADFSHDKEIIVKGGIWRVRFKDLSILISHWNVREPPDGPGIEPNCLDVP